MAVLLRSNVDDPRFSAEPTTPTDDWRDDLAEAIEANGPYLPDFVSALVEALQHLWR